MLDNNLINRMAKKAATGSKKDIARLINNYRPVIFDIISSLEINENCEDFIHEGINAILYAIYYYDYRFYFLHFDSYVKIVIEERLNDYKINYYKDYEHSEDAVFLPNKLNGENIYESEDSLVDAVGNLNCHVVCDGEISSVVDTFVSSSDDTEKEVINNLLSDELEQSFIESGLFRLEIEFLKCKYGFYGQCFTNDEICRKFKISSQDVERVLDDALFKLRTSNYIKKLSEYTENPKRSLDYIYLLQGAELCYDEEKITSFDTDEYSLKKKI